MKYNRGMTVIEVLLALALSAVIISLIYMILSLFIRTYQNNINSMDAHYSARMIAFHLNKDIRSSKQIELDGNERIIITMEDGILSYYMEDGTVYRHSRVKIPIAEKVFSLHFDQYDDLINYSVITGTNDSNFTLDVTCGSRTVFP